MERGAAKLAKLRLAQTDAAPFPAPRTDVTARSTGLNCNGNFKIHCNRNRNRNGNGNGRSHRHRNRLQTRHLPAAPPPRYAASRRLSSNASTASSSIFNACGSSAGVFIDFISVSQVSCMMPCR